MKLKQLIILFVCIITSIAVTACNGVETNSFNNTNYGQYVGESTAGDSLTKAGLQQVFTPFVLCRGTVVDANPTTKQLQYCGYNVQEIATNPIFGIPAGVNPLLNFVGNAQPSITGIRRDRLFYTTPGAGFLFAGGAVSKETVSGLVLVPNGLAESQIKGVIIYYHPTIPSKFGVPSGYGNGIDPVNNTSSTLTQSELAAIYAYSGYIVVAPDYIGQGIDYARVHPYIVFPQPNALSGIYMLTALKTYLSGHGIDITKINASHPNLYITSYSEGGSYALWASKLIQSSYNNIVSNAGLVLKRTVAIAGAYDLTNVQLPFGFDEVKNTPDMTKNIYHVSPGCAGIYGGISATTCGTLENSAYSMAAEQNNLASSIPVLTGDIINALITYNYTPAAYNLIMVPGFAEQKTCIDPSTLNGNYVYIPCSKLPQADGAGGSSIYEIFNRTDLNLQQISKQLAYAAMGSSMNHAFMLGGNPSFLITFDKLASGDSYNSVSSFVYPSLLKDTNVMAYIAQANIVNWVTNSPVNIIYMRFDSVVTNQNSLSVCSRNMASLYSNSPQGMVNCINMDNDNYGGVDNTKLWNIDSSTGLPLYLEHGNADGISQLVALHAIEAN